MKKLLLLGSAALFWAGMQSQNCIVAHYPLDASANDISGNMLHGTVNGAVPTTDRFGRPNSAYEFDGTDDVISVTSNNLFNFGTNDNFSISLWFRMDDMASSSSGNFILLSKFDDNGSNPGGFPYSVRIFNSNHSNAGQVHALRRDLNSCGNRPEITGNNAWDDGNYHHAVFVKNGSSLHLYVDNALRASGVDITSCQTHNSTDLRIGAKGGTNNSSSFFEGDIDDVMIYDCALTSTDIDSLYNVTPWVGIEPVREESGWTVYPNPNSGILNFEFDQVENTTSITQLINANGEVVFKGIINEGEKQLVLPKDLPNGIYYLQLLTEGQYESEKIVIDRH